MNKLLYPALVVAIAFSHTSYADVAAGLHASTNGLGANVTVKINDKVTLRAW